MKEEGSFLKRIQLFDWLFFATFLSTAFFAVFLFHYAYAPLSKITRIGMVVGDIVPVAIVLAFALYTRKAFWSGLFILVSVSAIGLRVGQFFLYKIGSLPLTYDSLKMLWEHYDHRSAQVMVGEYYLPLSILGAILLIAGIIWLSFPIKRAIRDLSDQQRDKRLIVLMILLLLGFASHGHYYCERYISNDGESYYSGHIVTPMPILVRNIIQELIRDILPQERKPGFTKASFSEEEGAFLKEMGLCDAPAQGNALDIPFDRIVIVAVESLDSDFISSCNSEMPEGLTAGMDKLKKDYVSLDNYFSAAMPTSWGLNTYFLSRMDYRRDAHLDNVAFCSILRDQHNIHSYYFSPIRGTFGENREYYKKLFDYDHGFFEKELREKYDFMRSNEEWGFTDFSMYRATLQFLKNEAPDKYFIVVSTMDSHAPYTPTGPAKNDDKFSDRGRFYQTMHCVDRNLTDFVKGFTSDPEIFTERTLLIITADHAASHGKNYTRRKSLGYPARIPLIMISRDNRAAKYFDPVKHKYCSSLDLPATLLAMLGSKIPDTFMGQDIRTKKSFALGKTILGEFMLYLPGDDYISVDIQKKTLSKNIKRRALQKYYLQYYPEEK